MKLDMESDVITEDIMRIERDVFEALYNSKSCQSGFENNRVAKKYMDAEKKIWIWEFLFWLWVVLMSFYDVGVVLNKNKVKKNNRKWEKKRTPHPRLELGIFCLGGKRLIH